MRGLNNLEVIEMKSRITILAAALSFLVTGAAFAQWTVPLHVKARYHKMPKEAAEANREGIEFAAYSASSWYKGNTHCHSDTDGERMPGHGDGPPEVTLAWYAEHDYDFMALTDHNIWHEDLDAPEGLLYIPSEEVTHMLYHMNALGGTGYIRPAFGRDRITAFQHGIDETLAQGGVPVINHPATPLAFITQKDLGKLKGCHHFEVRNMQPGNYTKLIEPMWDALLTDGYVWYGMATDDAHMFASDPPPIGNPPGGGFIMVDAPELTQDAVIEAIRVGRFYSSTGVLLKSYEVTKESIEIQLDHPEPCEIEFIGAFGETLQSDNGDRAKYQTFGDELYVRIRVTDPGGKEAFTQPVFYR